MGEKEQVIQALRATLISVKGALTIKQCNRDYRELQGEWIPFKKLGYPSLDKLFLDVPGFKVNQINGEWYVDAIASQETQHIASMVAKQKSNKKPASKFKFNNRFPKSQDSWRKPATYNSYSTTYSNQYSNQYYRAKGGTNYNYNNNNVKYNNKYSKTTETRYPSYGNTKSKPAELPTESVTYYPPPVAPVKSAPAASNIKQEKRVPAKETENQHTTQAKHPNPRVENEVSEVKVSKPSGKVSASQRMAHLRDRLSSVDLIPLQLPAAAAAAADCRYAEPLDIKPPPNNTTPIARLKWMCETLGLPKPVINEDVPAASALEPPPDSTTPVAMLEWTCQKLGLPQPVYKVHDYKPKRGAVCYDCSVKVGSTYSATSYPDSAPSEELAREMAAVKLMALIESSEAGGLRTASAAAAAAALPALVADHEAGLWASMLPHLYREKYQENLPSNWQELVENCPLIKMDRVVNGLLVLLPNNENGRSSYQDVTGNLEDGSEASVASEEFGEGELPPLQFPAEVFWNVFVTVANSTLEVWLRIVGQQYSDHLESLQDQMDAYYAHQGTPVDRFTVVKNAWYAVYIEAGEWARGKVLETGEGACTVFLGDHGDDVPVPYDHIRQLEPQFRALPAQAILCRLEGAEELGLSSVASELCKKRLPGEQINSDGTVRIQVLVAAPGARDDPLEPAVSVVLYDTTTTRDVNLNREIIHDFCTAGAFNISQRPCSVEAGCVTEDGRVWVGRVGGAALVRGALALLTTPGPYRRPLPSSPAAPLPRPDHDPTLYIVRTLDGDWVRCTIISGLDGEGTVRTQLVDSGMVLRAPLSSLVPLAAFSPALNEFPPQALCVRLGGAERAAAAMTSRLRELLLNTSVLCRALPGAGAGACAQPQPPPPPPPPPPPVELFVRTAPMNMLASVNNAINVEYDYLQLGKPKEQDHNVTVDNVEVLHRKKERIFRSASSGVGSGGSGGASTAGGSVASGAGDEARGRAGPLPAPALPSVGRCFDVYIAMAANPWNFVVQPNSTRRQLQSMMESLQAECPKYSVLDAPRAPASGDLYTVYYDKYSSWYRVVVAGVVSADMVSVHFCDFGDMALFSNSELRPAPAPARALPPQAVKARLYNVSPLHQDWTVEDCIRFQELCVEQQFVGICKEVGRDPLNPGEPLVTLDLIDTSTDEDVFLNRQLVAEGRARLDRDA